MAVYHHVRACSRVAPQEANTESRASKETCNITLRPTGVRTSGCDRMLRESALSLRVTLSNGQCRQMPRASNQLE